MLTAKELGQKIAEARRKRNLSQQHLADRLGMSGSGTIAAWEGGRNYPEFANFLRLCKILNRSPAYFFGDAYQIQPEAEPEEALAERLTTLEATIRELLADRPHADATAAAELREGLRELRSDVRLLKSVVEPAEVPRLGKERSGQRGAVLRLVHPQRHEKVSDGSLVLEKMGEAVT